MQKQQEGLHTIEFEIGMGLGGLTPTRHIIQYLVRKRVRKDNYKPSMGFSKHSFKSCARSSRNKSTKLKQTNLKSNRPND